MAREKMSSVDQAWLRMDSPQNLMMIVGVQVFDAPVKLAKLRELIEARLLAFKRFRQKVELDATGAWWVTDRRFDLDEHLVVHTLPGAGSSAQMQAYVAELASTPLNPDRPLWQFHLIENYDGTNAFISRIHHCIADGIALVAVMMELTDKNLASTHSGGATPETNSADESGRREIESNPWEPYLKPLTKGTIKAINSTRVAWSKSLDLVANPERLMDYAEVGSQVIRDAAKIALMPPDSPTRFKGKPGTNKRVAWNEPLPLDEVKAVAKVLGASINDVLLSCVAGALRRYLIAHGDDVTDCEVRAMVPVNLRPLKDALKLGNRFGLVPLLLPVGIANPLERLLEVRHRMNELKDGYQAVLAYAVLGVVGMAPRPVQRTVLDMLSRKSTAVMTNVPGPQQPIYFAGQALRRIMFWVPQSGDIGMGVSILSYSGGVQFGLITDSDLVPDPQAVIDGFEPEFNQLVYALSMMSSELALSGQWADSEFLDAFESQLIERANTLC
jgi:diacylglycerol O-acyltransferase / wax synthase